VDREVLLADGVQRRDQGDYQRGIANEEQSPARSIALVSVSALREPAVSDQVGDADYDQRQQQKRIGLKLRGGRE
jgi:hypothetical protein